MLTVLMPSRGREAQAREAYAAFMATKTLPDTKMLIVLDWNEPGYADLPTTHIGTHQSGHGMGPALNAGLDYVTADIIGFVGDDHRFRTTGWDAAITAANEALGGGIVYGNDLLRGEELPSQVFIDARIVRALGWMALPGAHHLFLDDTWRELGHAIGRLTYLPDVHIEHMHPTAGKAEWDENYARVNAGSMYEHDAEFFHEWMHNGIARDAERVTEALR